VRVEGGILIVERSEGWFEVGIVVWWKSREGGYSVRAVKVLARLSCFRLLL